MKKSKLNKKLIIGSANFTKKYGIASYKVNQDEIYKIFNLAKKNGIYKFDTAETYLKKKNIFKNTDKKFRFCTKILPDAKWVSLEYCQKKIEDHFNLFDRGKIDILFFHDIKILFSKNGEKIFKNLEILKKKNFFKKIGLSIYDTDCLEYLNSKYEFDAIQIPYNVFDKRILTSGWYKRLKNQKKEIHVRSIFLQGLLVNNLLYRNKYFKKWKKVFDSWFQFLKSRNMSPIDYCLSDALANDFDQIVIGVNNSKNLKKIINLKTIEKNKMISFSFNDTKLIDPRMWK